MKKIKKLLIAVFMFAIVMPLLLTGCKDDKSIKIWQEEGISEVKRGQELVISITPTKIELSNIDFVVEGSAVITNDGKLTVNNDAIVGSEIKVTASSEQDKVTSNELVFVVVDLKPTAINFTTSATVITKNSTIDLGIETTPSYATINDVTFSTDSEIAEIIDGKLKIKSDADTSKLIDQTPINITATLTADNSITSTIQVKYVVAQKLSVIMASSQAIDIHNTDTPKLNFTPYNEDLIELDRVYTNYAYESSDESVATVTNNGEIKPHKHGKTDITITYRDNSSIKTTIPVYIIATPNAITFDATKTSTHIFDKKEMYYSIADPTLLKLDLLGTDFNGVQTSQKFKYEFSNENLDTSESIATVANNEITFKKTGDIKVKITSDSSIDGLEKLPSTVAEKTLECVIHVNNGKNIRTVSELQSFADSTNDQSVSTINILNNLYLTDTDNFGKETDISGLETIYHKGLHFLGSTYIFGNGYTLDASQLTCLDSDNKEDFHKGKTILEFSRYDNGIFTAQIKDFNLKGSVTTSKQYKNFYSRAIHIHGQYFQDITNYDNTQTYGYVKDMIIDNVNIDGFGVGMRINHAVDGLIKNTSIQNCYSNGIESDQNIITLQDIHLGQLGAFGIEVTPDDLNGAKTNNPRGTAGIHYNETPRIDFKGSIISDNYNNGVSTEYIKTRGYEDSKNNTTYTFVNILDAIIMGNIQAIAGTGNENLEAQLRLLKVSYKVMRNYDRENKNIDLIQNLEELNSYFQDKSISLYLLIFVNKGDGMIYDGGNTNSEKPLSPTHIYNEGKFLEFPDNTSNMINLSYLLRMVKANPNWDEYKAYQYIQMDLNTGDMMGNIGQVILVNQAYDPNYKTTNA